MIIGLILLLVVPLAACGQGSSLRDEVTRAIQKTSEVTSYREEANSTLYSQGITYVTSSVLECAAPDRYHSVSTTVVDDAGNVTTTTTVDYGNFTCISSATTSGGWFETIVVGDKGYVRSQREPQWRVCEVYTPDSQPPPGPTPGTGTCQVSIQTSDKQLELLNYLIDLERFPDEEIGGLICRHYRGEIDQDAYVDLVRKRNHDIPPENLELLRRREMDIELWVDGDDHIRQYILWGSFPGPTAWAVGFSITRYSDFNEPISIEPPEIE